MWSILEDETPHISHGIPAVKELIGALNQLEDTMLNKDALASDLTEAFIQYQYRLEHPWAPGPDTRVSTESSIKDLDMPHKAYLSDPIYRAKVRHMVAGVMSIVDTHLEDSHVRF